MKKLCALALFALFVAPIPAHGEESRLRLENPGKTGRVEIVRSQRHVQSVEAVDPSAISGETITVEGLRTELRLEGGSLQVDPLLEAVVSQKLRASARRSPTVLVLPAPQRFRPEPNRHWNYPSADFGLVYGPGHASTYVAPVARSVRPSCGSSQSSGWRTKSSRSSSTVRGSYSSRAMISKR